MLALPGSCRLIDVMMNAKIVGLLFLRGTYRASARAIESFRGTVVSVRAEVGGSSASVRIQLLKFWVPLARYAVAH